MSKHVHSWVLVDSYDSWKREAPKSSLPEAQFVSSGGLFGGVRYIGPSVQDIQRDMCERVLETINRSEEPHYTSETWVCVCGKSRTNSRTGMSINDYIFSNKPKVSDSNPTNATKGEIW